MVTVTTLSPNLAIIFWLLFFLVPPLGYFVVPMSKDERPQLVQTLTLLIVTLAASFTILSMGADGILVVIILAFTWHLWWTALLDISRRLQPESDISSVFHVAITGYADYIQRFGRFLKKLLSIKKSR